VALGRCFNLGRLKFVERTIKNGWFGGMLPREILKSSLGNAISCTFWRKIGKLIEQKCCKKSVSRSIFFLV
jgi:hypothetical protein